MITFTGGRIFPTIQEAHNRFYREAKQAYEHTDTMNINGNEILTLSDPLEMQDQRGAFMTQIMPTLKCNHDCGFCIEDATGKKHSVPANEEAYVKYVDKLLNEVNANGYDSVITITGGEPLLNYNRISKILDVVKDKGDGVVHYGVNTNGTLLRDPKYVRLMKKHLDTGKFHVNISRHHYDDDVNAKIFKSGKPLSIDELKKVNEELDGQISLQLVLNEEGIDNKDELKKYIQKFSNDGFKRITVRGMVDLDNIDGSNKEKVDYSLKNKTDFKTLVEEIDNDDDFEFVNEEISPIFINEYYKYNDTLIKLVYTDMTALDEVEKEISAKGKQPPANMFVVMPDMETYGSWNYPNCELTSQLDIKV